MPSWLITLLSVAAGAVITWVITHVCNTLVKNSTRYKEKKKAEEDARTKSIVKAVLLEEVMPRFDTLATKQEEIRKEVLAQKEADVVQIRMTLKDKRDKYLEQGYADTSDKSTWNELYDKYSDLGGNHFVQWVNGWKEDVENLPNPTIKNKK